MHIAGSLLALTLFAFALLPAVDAGVSSRRAVVRGQRSLEQTLAAYRLLRWASAQPVEDLRKLPARTGVALPSPWPARLDAQRGDAQVQVACEPDVDGRRGLCRLVVVVDGVRLTQMVVR